MGPRMIVMSDVNAQDPLEVTAPEDQQPVQALSSYCSDPAIRVGVGLRGSDRGANYADPLGAEDLIEWTAELGVTIADQKQRREVSGHGEIASLLGHPGTTGMGCDPS